MYCEIPINISSDKSSFHLVTEQREKLSEVEQQLKKAEAAQRRRMQAEKAARESEVLTSFTEVYIANTVLIGFV